MIFTFGKYKGFDVDNVPASYLVYALENFTLSFDLTIAIKNAIVAQLHLISTSAITTDNNSVREVYRSLSKKYHPDLGGNTTAMQAINEFYELLTK